MKKRVIAVLTAVLMTASLVGCGSGKLSNDYVTVNKYKGLEVTEVAKNEVSDDSVEQEVQSRLEAASRSLPEYTEETISNLVDKIIDSQVTEGYFKECPITFKDIATVKAVFKEKLKIAYHTRISYPELKK